MPDLNLVSDDDLRNIIRKRLVNEITDFGTSLHFKPLQYGTCEIKIPPGLRKIFAYAMSGGRNGKGIDALPAFKKMFPFVIDVQDAVITELDTIMDYLNAAANMAGVGTLQCTLLSIGLEAMAVLLIALGFIEEAKEYKEESKKAGSLSISFDKEIREKGMKVSGGELDGFKSVYPFYVLPRTAKQGPSSVDADLLNKDIDDYESMLTSVKTLEEQDVGKMLFKLSDSMNIELDNKEWGKIKSADLSDRSSDAFAVKAQAIKDLKYAAGRAVQQYQGVVSSGTPESLLLENFLANVVQTTA